MAKKRNFEISNINNHDDPRITTINVDRNEIMKLTKAAKSWDFTCSFCFKKFPSAQAMGGHQNAHRSERLEEKRLYVKDPIGYRKRAYLRAMKAESSSSSTAGAAADQIQNLHATPKMEIGGGPPKTLQQKTLILCGQFGEFNVADHHVNYKYNFCKPSSSTKIIINGDDENLIRKKGTVHLMNFLPPKELSLAERIIGLHAEDDGEGELGGYGVYLDQKLDLTLKL